MGHPRLEGEVGEQREMLPHAEAHPLPTRGNEMRASKTTKLVGKAHVGAGASGASENCDATLNQLTNT
jgi:hypothetical protein